MSKVEYLMFLEATWDQHRDRYECAVWDIFGKEKNHSQYSEVEIFYPAIPWIPVLGREDLIHIFNLN